LFLKDPDNFKGFKKGHKRFLPQTKTNKTELIVQSQLTALGIKFEIHKRIGDFYTQPDIFVVPNICIFVDGCYWHQCSTHSNKTAPRNRRDADARVNNRLTSLGYKVIRIWEHDITKSSFDIRRYVEL
jgi:DNA mismatch endonuclease, patch repair protein